MNESKEFVPNEKISEELKRFEKFAFKGRMIETAIAFTMGVLCNKFISSISTSFVMPFLGYLFGDDWRAVTWEPKEGLVFETGLFLGATFDFLVISIIIYVIYIKVLKSDDK